MTSLAALFAEERPGMLEEGRQCALRAVRSFSRRPKPLEQYQRNPVAYAVERLGIPEHTIRWSLNPGYEGHVWDGTPDPLVAMVEALARWEDAGVESATGTAKSYTLGWLYLWFLASFEGARVFSFAPKEDQLRLYSWMELRKHWPKFQRDFPDAELTDLRIRMIPRSDEWGAWGYPVGVRAQESAGGGIATKAAGMHAEHMLLVYEETPGIPPPVLAAGEQTCTGPHNLRLAVGNPDHAQDALHQHCIDPGVKHIRISALDFPNVVTGSEVIPGAVSAKRVERRRVKYGEDSPLFYLSRVRGICPLQAVDALIRQEWIDAAVARWKNPEERRRLAELGLPGLGVDIANSEDGDKAAIARGRGACLDEVVAFPCPDSVRLGTRINAEMKLFGVDEMHVGVDVSGDASTANKLKEHGKYVQRLNSGSGALPRVDEELLRDEEKAVREEETFRNLRAQMWWRLRMDLQHGRIALPPDPELHRDLVVPKWKSVLGKIQVEEKLEIRKRLGRSPDKGDACVYWNWVRFRREVKDEELPPRAFAPEVLEHEALETRRVRERKVVRANVNPILLESLK